MKNHTLQRFHWRWAAAALLLLGSNSPLFAQLQLFSHYGSIQVDFTLSPGNNPTTPFSDFFNDPVEAVVAGGYIFCRSPEGGESYYEKCPSQSTTPLPPPPTIGLPITAKGTLVTFVNAHKLHFATLANTGSTATYPIADNYCLPYWVDIYAQLAYNTQLASVRKSYNGTSFRSDALFLNDGDPLKPFAMHSITEEVGALHVVVKCENSSLPGMLLKATANGNPFITATINEDPSILPDGCGLPYWDLSTLNVNLQQSIPGRAGTLQATVNFQDPTHLLPDPYIDETFLVKANHKYRVNVKFATTGTDPNNIVIPNIGECNELSDLVLPGHIVTVTCTSDAVFCDSGINNCLAVDGRMAMRNVGNTGDMPLRVQHYAVMEYGPWGNQRFGDVDPGPPSPDPNYQLWTMIPSGQVTPPQPYTPGGIMWFQPDTALFPYEFELMQTPTGIPIMVDCKTTVHLPTLLVIDPGFLTGNIRLVGPKVMPSSLGQIYTRTDNSDPAPANPNYWANVSHVTADNGYSPSGGGGRVWSSIRKDAFTDATSTTEASWNGAYVEFLGGLNGEPSTWDIGGLTLALSTAGNPQLSFIFLGDNLAAGSYQPCAGVVSQPPDQLCVMPQQSYVNDHDYCFSELEVEFINPDPVNLAIGNPKLTCFGSYGMTAGIPTPLPDPLNPSDWASYSAVADFWGTPYNTGPGNATVRLCLPTGSYTVRPTIDYSTSAAEGAMGSGSFSLPNIGCKMVYHLQLDTNGISPIFDVGSVCTAQSPYTFQGSVYADTGHNLTEVSYTQGGITHTVYSGGSGTYNLGSISPAIALDPCENTITLTATDDLQRSSSVIVTITLDTTVPVITCPPDTTVACGVVPDPTVTGVATATGGCPPITITPSDTVTPATCSIDRTWTAVDVCTHVATCVQHITLAADTTPPVVTTAAGSLNVTLQCSDLGGIAAALALAPVATDDCTPIPTIHLVSDVTTPDLLCASAYVRVRTWNFSDGCGNTSANFVQTITVQNTALPDMICPLDITTNCMGDAGVVVNYSCPTATSHCSESVSVTCDPPSGHQFPIGQTLVTCTAVDTCGNTKICTFYVTVVSPGRWTWARQAGDYQGDPVQPAAGNAVAVDANGNVFVTGSYQGAMIFRNSSGAQVQILYGMAGNDLFLAKYDYAGVFKWAVRAGVTGNAAGYGVAVDSRGHVYVTGGFEGTATFESYLNSSGGTYFGSLTSHGGSDIFVAKYDSYGACLWVTQDGDIFNDRGAGIAVTPTGDDVFVTGTRGITSSQGGAFVRKLSGSGAPLGLVVSTDAGDQSSQGRAIALDPSGNPYVTGIYNSGLTPMLFGTCSLPATGGAGRIFVCKFDPNLGCLWATHSHGPTATGAHDGTGVAVDPTGQYCYATAYFNGTADFGNNQSVVSRFGTLNDYLIVQLNTANGLPAWATAGGTFFLDDGETRGIAVDPDGNPCVTGFVQPYAPNNGVNEGPTVIVRSYDKVGGSLRWSRDAADGPSFAQMPQDVGLGIAVGPDGCAHVTGAFTEDLTFAPVGLPVATLNSSQSDVRDMFVAKMCPSCCPLMPMLNIVISGGNIVLSWDSPCCHLEGTYELKGASTVWHYVSNTSPVTLQVSGQQFFRLVCP
jgi:hypothetical protein